MQRYDGKAGIVVLNKSRKKLNVVDIVIFAVILIALAYAVYAIIVNMQNSGGAAKIEYTIEVPEIRNEISDKVSEGESVYDENGDWVGVVKSVAVSQAYHKGSDEDGNVVNSRIDGYNTMYVTIEVDVTATGSGYEVNGYDISAGNEYDLRTPSLYFEGECVNVRLLND